MAVLAGALGVIGFFVHRLISQVDRLERSMGKATTTLETIRVLCHERHGVGHAHRRITDGEEV
jgi:hypothetical protein